MAIRRKIDDLGRVVLPMEMRNELKYARNQPIQIEIVEGKIMLSKTSEGCDLCESDEKLISKGQYLLCNKCLFEITGK